MSISAPAGKYEDMADEKSQLFQVQREPGFVMAGDVQAAVAGLAEETSRVLEALQRRTS